MISYNDMKEPQEVEITIKYVVFFYTFLQFLLKQRNDSSAWISYWEGLFKIQP